jgi:hypothetical protein
MAIKNGLTQAPMVGLDVFFQVVDDKQAEQRTAAWFAADHLTGILSGPQNPETCRMIQDFFDRFGAARGTPVDWPAFVETWDSECQSISQALDEWVIWGDGLGDFVVREPVRITAGESLAFLYDILKGNGPEESGLPGVIGFGCTRIGKLLGRNFPKGVVPWDTKNFRSLWGVKGNAEGFVSLQAHAQAHLQRLLLEVGRRGGLSVEDAMRILEERALRPGSRARFKYRRDLPKLMDEFFQGLPAYLVRSTN